MHRLQRFVNVCLSMPMHWQKLTVDSRSHLFCTFPKRIHIYTSFSKHLEQHS